MKKITDYKEVSPLVFKYFKRGVITNNFLSAEDYKCEIKEGRLFYNQGKDYLNIYVKRDGFYQLYFHALSETAEFPQVDEMLVCDISNYDGELLKINGFCENMKRVKLEINGQATGISSLKAETEDAGKIHLLMTKSFDKFTGYMPNFTQIQAECERGMFLKIEESGNILGALRYGKSGKVAQIKHLCVDACARGNGIGKKICAEFLKENPKATVWTGKENKAALSLYKALGFCESGTESIVYMKG